MVNFTKEDLNGVCEAIKKLADTQEKYFIHPLKEENENDDQLEMKNSQVSLKQKVRIHFKL